MTLEEKLDAAIDRQREEVDRIEQSIKADLPTAQEKLAQLEGIRKLLTPAIEEAFATVKALGIRLDEDKR